MDGILEQVLTELREIKQLLKGNQILNLNTYTMNQSENCTMTIKQAASYLGISEWRLRIHCKQKTLRHFTAGNRLMFRKSTLDSWIQQIQEDSIQKEREPELKNGIRRIKA